MDWHQVREGVVSGETHYKAILDAARVRKRSFEKGRKTGRPEGRPDRGCGQVGLGPAGGLPGPAPLYGPRPPEWGLTPGPNSRMHVAPSGWADPPAWDQEGGGGKPLTGVGIWCSPLRDDRFLQVRRRARMWFRKQQYPCQPVCLAPKRC